MRYLICDARAPGWFWDAAREHGLTPLPLPSFSRLGPAVCGHMDTLFCILEGKLYCHRDYYADPAARQALDRFASLSGLAVETTIQPIGPDYPDDILFNVLCMEHDLFGLLPKVSKKIIEAARRSGYRLHSVRQGYARCSACPVGSGGVITADPGLGESFREAGYDVLLIRPGHISLPGLNQGFIGGCAGRIGDALVFCGDLDTHPDAPGIREFAALHGMSCQSFGNGPLTDIGGFAILAEKDGDPVSP